MAATVARLQGLQYVRAVAAVMVVAHHTNEWYHHSVPRRAPVLSWLNLGGFGVDLFFVLSGFIMVHVYGHLLVHPRPNIGSSLHFLGRRMARIYPIYWVVTLLAIPAFYRFNFHPIRDIQALITTFSLVPLSDYYVLQVPWTLSHEMKFYAAIAAASLLGRAWRVVMALAIALLSGLVATAPQPPARAELGFLLSGLNLELLAGMALGFLYPHTVHRVRRWHTALLLLVGAGVFALSGVNYLRWNIGIVGPGFSLATRVLTFGVASCILVFAAAHIRGYSRVGVLLGDCSYVLYLVHIPVIVLFAHKWVYQGFVPATPWAFASAAALAVIVSVPVHLLLERPLINWCNRRIDNMRRATQVGGSLRVPSAPAVGAA